MSRLKKSIQALIYLFFIFLIPEYKILAFDNIHIKNYTTGGDLTINPTFAPEPTLSPNIVDIEVAKPTSKPIEEEKEDNNSKEGTMIINVDTSILESELEEIKEELLKYKPAVTVVYSINNEIDKCYYKPKIEQLPNIKSWLEQQGHFVSVYDEFFNMFVPSRKEDGSYESVSTEVYKPEGTQCRELEILGYDFLLDYEWFQFSDNQAEEQYITIQTGTNVKYGTAIMDIYKAIGKEIFYCNYNFYEDKSVTLTSSPVALNLPSYVSELDNSRAKTRLFITRTYPQLYYEKALKDLNVVADSSEKYITNGDFIILLAKMMNFYGEPVLSESEMNLLLQVYGSDIPSYLSKQELDAYLYLKSRGVLNLDLDYTEFLRLEDMLNILMCVKDKDSRTNYKEINITTDIGEELVKEGYFPKVINMVSNEDALEFSEPVYDYSKATEYDYYVLLQEETKFRTKENKEITELYVYNIPHNLESGASSLARYLGIVTDEDGNSYYHFCCNIDSEWVDTYGNVVTEIQINSSKGDDYPKFIALEQGGGIYTYKETTETGRAITERRNFKEKEFEGAVSKERKTESTKETLQSKSILSRLFSLVNPTITTFAIESVYPTVYNEADVYVKFDIYNAKNILWYDESLIQDVNSDIIKAGDTWHVTIRKSKYERFLSSIQRNYDINTRVSYTAIANLFGDILIDYVDLVEAGLCFNDDYNSLPEADDGILILNTTYGQIKLNNKTKEIIVGNTLYRVKANSKTVLFKYVYKNGTPILKVDFRVIYGWGSDRLKTVITGSGSEYTVNIQTVDKAKAGVQLKDISIVLPLTFRTSSDKPEIVKALPAGIIDSTKSPKFLMTSGYPLANWMIFQGADSKSGTEVDYLFIFYPKKAFDNTDIEPPNDMQLMCDIVGYVVNPGEGLWCCRAINITGIQTAELGKMTYTKDFGYVYNMPTWNDFTMEAYLKGELYLPLSYNENNFVNSNLNIFEGYDYGYRPKGNTKDTSTVGIYFKDQSEKEFNVNANGVAIYATPAGVIAYYGGDTRTYYKLNADSLLTSTVVEGYHATGRFFYGTNACEPKSMTTGSNRGLYFTYRYRNTYSKISYMPEDSKFYRVATLTNNIESTDTQALLLTTYWIMNESSLETKVSKIEKTIEAIEIEEIDAEQKDAFTDYKEFSFTRLIESIDFGATYIIVFVFEIFPMLGIILLTILIGLCFMGDFRAVRRFASTVIDPVKIFTFGKRTMENFRVRDCLWSLVVGYIIFGLIYNGNLFRLIEWSLTQFSKLTELIKQI